MYNWQSNTNKNTTNNNSNIKMSVHFPICLHIMTCLHAQLVYRLLEPFLFQLTNTLPPFRTALNLTRVLSGSASLLFDTDQRSATLTLVFDRVNRPMREP